MDIKIIPSKLHGTVNAVSSKSYAHRILIAAALSEKETVINLNAFSYDINATIECLCVLGAKISSNNNSIKVIPAKAPKNAVLDCKESGSTLRFLIPVACALCDNSEFIGQGRLPNRPISPLREEMEKNGCSFSAVGEFPIKVSGKLKSGKFHLSGNVSSQFITGLLFALPLLNEDSEIILTSQLESKPYVDMTIEILNKFNIEIKEEQNSYFIKGNQKYISPKEITVEGDWSNSAFWLCCGALGSDITVSGLSASSLQGDKAVLDILKNMGANIKTENNLIKVSAPNELKPIEINASQAPDLIPVLSVVSAFAKGDTVISNAQRLRLKECDRLSAISNCLNSLGGQACETPDSLVIHGVPKINGGTADSFNDHRIAMSLSVLASRAENPVIITNADAINKSYPSFFEDYKSLGGNFYVINNG